MEMRGIARIVAARDRDRAASLADAADLCGRMARTATCREAKDAIVGRTAPEGRDSHEWRLGSYGALVTINQHAQRRGVDPYMLRDDVVGNDDDA